MGRNVLCLERCRQLDQRKKLGERRKLLVHRVLSLASDRCQGKAMSEELIAVLWEIDAIDWCLGDINKLPDYGPATISSASG
ncbi:MAG: hypothetical protein J7647_32090 [Cyanobacteria bacterium SBLK]|nr:hypothetical protein [Cyanobacteria bacterium SBLK]